MRARVKDARPYLALAGLAALALVLLSVPTTREWLLTEVVESVRAQADPAPGLKSGYSVASMIVWALVGLVLGWVAYDVVFTRLGYVPDRAFFFALSPYLLLGPLLHALLAAGAVPQGSLLAYFAAEPPVYLTVGACALLGLTLGRALRRPTVVPLVVGAFLLLPLLLLAAVRLRGPSLGLLGLVLLLALVPAFLAAGAYRTWKPREDASAVFAVVAAHALDGGTTWMVLRDPFGLGVEAFSEKNPVSLLLVNLSNGWPYYALKLALPLVLLTLVKVEAGEERMRAFLLLAVFVLGYGPGMSNLLQVLLG